MNRNLNMNNALIVENGLVIEFLQKMGADTRYMYHGAGMLR